MNASSSFRSRWPAPTVGGFNIGMGMVMLADPIFFGGIKIRGVMGALLIAFGFIAIVTAHPGAPTSGVQASFPRVAGPPDRFHPIILATILLGLGTEHALLHLLPDDLRRRVYMDLASVTSCVAPLMYLYLKGSIISISAADEVEYPHNLPLDGSEENARRIPPITGRNSESIPEGIPLRLAYEGTTSRIRTEIGALRRRGNLNLVIGIATTGLAILILARLVLSTATLNPEVGQVLRFYVPRITFVVFVEVFSFFFLRLHKSSLEGIKYFHNELTNIELRFIALETALLRSDNDSITTLIGEFAKTERNFVLRHGDTPIELKQAEIERDIFIKLAGVVPQLRDGVLGNVK